jgi:hypothetical protein
LVREFGQLLRSIVSTIDRFGLKHRHLNKHRADVDRFFRAVAGRRYGSDAAESYQSRLAKNEDKLFTFLRHDGVPWNNNNAKTPYLLLGGSCGFAADFWRLPARPNVAVLVPLAKSQSLIVVSAPPVARVRPSLLIATQ